MGYFLEFTFCTVPLTLNEVMSSHWRKRHTNFERIKEEIRILLLNKKPSLPLAKANVSFIRYSPGTLDPDNAYFTGKPILDALVREGILQDDGFEMIKRLSPSQIKIKRTEQRKITVRVEEVL